MRLVKVICVEGKTERRIPKKRWLDVIESDMKWTGVIVEDKEDEVK